MSYIPTTWATGDVITAEKLNNMESGIVGSAKVLFVEINEETGALNKTWNEINNALLGHVPCLTVRTMNGATLFDVITTTYQVEQSQYYVYWNFGTPQQADLVAIAETPDGYPVVQP